MILAIDTATGQAGLALLRDGDIVAELSWTASGNHSSTLTPALRLLLHSTGTRITQVEAITVCSGPGSFSGLRVGISEAKGLAMALEAPVIGIPSLDALALGGIAVADPLWAVIRAGRGRVYLARYEGAWSTLRRTSAYTLCTIREGAALTGDEAITGEAAPELVVEGSVSRVLPAALRLRRPGFLAELGRRYLEEGGTDQRDVLEPLYLRLSAAEEKRAAAPQE